MSCMWKSLPINNNNGNIAFDEYYGKETTRYHNYWRGKRSDGSENMLYYFCNTINEVFDKSKVGK